MVVVPLLPFLTQPQWVGMRVLGRIRRGFGTAHGFNQKVSIRQNGIPFGMNERRERFNHPRTARPRGAMSEREKDCCGFTGLESTRVMLPKVSSAGELNG